jgi:hypothetical protein
MEAGSGCYRFSTDQNKNLYLEVEADPLENNVM